ncbi:hypothetical protein [Pseudomonas sp. 382]|uniref:hypothetical protein n=1 Tax=Pseudomonas sp. 382 TaxID=1751969 RepID=UPI00117AE5A3|nr:hypothetical protein [Pseudomonas sp. 382]
MPERLTEIFDLAITPSLERHAKIAACQYASPILEAAEEFRIFSESSSIANTEGLARILESPNAVEPDTGKYTASAFMEATRRGISTQRIGMTTERAIHEFGETRVSAHNEKSPEKPRTYLGYTVGIVSMFRSATAPDGRRLFGVFSTPEPELEHADIFVVVKPDKALKMAIQRVFYDAFKIEQAIIPQSVTA